MKVRDLYSASESFVGKSVPREEARPVERAPKLEPVRTAPKPEPYEVDRIVRVWLDNCGLSLNPDTVRNHIETLRRWQRRMGK